MRGLKICGYFAKQKLVNLCPWSKAMVLMVSLILLVEVIKFKLTVLSGMLASSRILFAFGGSIVVLKFRNAAKLALDLKKIDKGN